MEQFIFVKKGQSAL